MRTQLLALQSISPKHPQLSANSKSIPTNDFRTANSNGKVFLEQSDISNDEELYQYGFFILLSQILYFIITIVIGILLGIVLESIIFYIAFQFIRRYAGGYHASMEIRCEVMSTLSILVCLVVIRLSKTYDFQFALLIVSSVSAVCIAVLCPLDTPEKPLSEKEFKYFRKISWLILSVISLVVAISYFVRLKWLQIFFVPCCLSLILESLLLTAGKVKKLTLNKSE